MSNEERKEKDSALTVLCRNLYLGADFNLLFPQKETSLSLAQIVANFYRAVEDTRYHERVQFLAKEIADRQPHIVCLQEVYDYQLPDHQQGINFIDLLEKSLQSLHVHYKVASVSLATDVKLPILWKDSLGCLQVKDQVLVLVRDDVEVNAESHAQYQQGVSLPLPYKGHADERLLTVSRAYNRVIIQWNNKAVAIGNTHLESIDVEIQQQQAEQLISAFSHDNGHVIIAGDMNAKPGSDSYNKFVQATHPYTDAFSGQRIKTFGMSAGLNEEYIYVHERIDHIFHRGSMSALNTNVFGIQRSERTVPSKLWPSDHAGLIATYLI